MHKFLSAFRSQLESRGSYRRYQKGRPYWSLWSTGPYTFSPYKVVWKEMSGGKFVSALARPVDIKGLGKRPMVPDHKLYFIPFDEEKHAAFVVGLLNAPIVSDAISAYASQLSLGVSVAEYVDIPAYDPTETDHQHVARIALEATKRGDATGEELEELDQLARHIFGVAQHLGKA